MKLSFNSINKHPISIKRRIFEIIRLTVIEIISNYKLVLENCSFQYCSLTDVNIAHSDVNIDALFTLSKQHAYQ